MSDFDAHHKWLGIPAAEQPPNHYRLLGISLFEKDRDVIIAALDQRQVFLKQKAVGPRGELAEPLLEQLQQARLCLLNRLMKAQYDSTLRQLTAGAVRESEAPAEPKVRETGGSLPKTQGSGSAGASPSQKTSPSQPKENFLFPTEAELGNATERDRQSKRRSRRISWAINVLVLCGIGTGIWWMQERGLIPPLNNWLNVAKKDPLQDDESADAGSEDRDRRDQSSRSNAKDQTAVRKKTKKAQATDSGRFANHGAAVTDFSLSADGRFLATVGGERECRVWNLATGETTARFTGHGGAIHAIALSPSGDQVVSSAESLMLWNAATGEAIGELTTNRRPARAIQFDRDNQRAVTVGAGAIEMWDIASRKQTQTISGVHPFCGTLALTENSQIVAATTGANSDVATLFDMNSGNDIRSFEGHKGRISSLVLSKSGSSLWTASADQTARRWNTQTGVTEAVFAHAHVAALSPNETMLATGGMSGVVTVWDAQTGAGLLQLPRQKLKVLDITFLPDSEHLLFAGDSTDESHRTATIQLWKIPKLDLKAPISRPNAIPIADATGRESSAAPNGEPSNNSRITQQPSETTAMNRPVDDSSKSASPLSTTETSAASNDNEEERLPTGKWIDLLANVKVPEHVLRGKWRKEFSAMICEPSAHARFQAPVALRGNYELNMEFTRRAGSEYVGVTLPVGPVSGTVFVSGYQGASSGLNLIDGREAKDVPAAARAGVRMGKLQNGHQYRLEIDVAQNNESAAVTAKLDGKVFVQWKGKVTQLSCAATHFLPCINSVGVIVNGSPADIHKLEVRIKPGSKGFRIGDDWRNPIEPVASAPPKAIADKCVFWYDRPYFITDKPMTLPDAQRLASLLSGRLLTISSAEEDAFILKEGRGLAFWISGWRSTEKFEWRDERNRKLDYFGKWGWNQPNNFADDCFLGIITATGRDRGWHDWAPNAALHAIIEWGEEYPTKK